MAMDAESTVVAGSPGTNLKHSQTGITEFEEIRENGTQKVTTVFPDGTLHRHIERTDPSSGVTTTIERHADGRIERIIEWPGGQKQSTTDWPDGHRDSYRVFKGPDGTEWTQTVDKENRFQTTHDTVDPDGTHRHVVKTFEGKVEVTTTKTTVQEDGSTMTQIKSPNGDITTRVERLDGTSQTSTMHPDGTDELVAVFREPDGTIITRSVARDGSETVDRRWLTPDGHEHRELREIDGSIKNWENWEDLLSDGTRVTHTNTPWANETTTNHPTGSYETVKNHSDGTISHFSHRQNSDGSVDEFHTRRDGKVSESHYEQNPDGSYSTRTNDYNGLERTTMVGRDGRVEIKTHHPDGSYTNTSYSSDGSGRTDYIDENGHIDGFTDIQPDPAPVPRGYSDPDEFIGPARRELPEDVGMATEVDEMQSNFAATPFTADQLGLLDDLGVSVPDARGVEADLEFPSDSLDVGVPGEDVPASFAADGGMAVGTGPADIGHTARRVISQKGPEEGTVVRETLPDGSVKWAVVKPDGKTFRSIERTDPSTGITTQVKRTTSGDIKTQIDGPGGDRQVTVRHPDGTEEVTRMFRGPDGSDWSQTFGPNGVRTVHRTFDPDGTVRLVEKTEDGTIEVTTTKSTTLPDETNMMEIHSANGDVSTITTWPDGSAEMRLVHPNGSQAFSTLVIDSDKVKILTEHHEDGSVTTQREWTEQDGSSMRTFTHPDGRVDEWRTYEFKQDDKSVLHVEESPEGIVSTTTFPNGSIMKETQYSDGRIDRWSYRKNPDGSAVERELLADGSKRETQYSSQNMEGSYTTVARGFDGSTTTTTLDMNGQMGVEKLNSDGTRVWSRFEADGSGRTRTFDASGNQTGENAIMPIPGPHPRNFQPDRFLEDAQREMPVAAEMQTEPIEASEDDFGAIPLTEDQQSFLEEHGAEIAASFPEEEMGGDLPAEEQPATFSTTTGDEDIGASGRRSFRMEPDGIKLTQELLTPQGAKSDTWLDPDGSATRRVEWTNPSTGIQSEVVRQKNGDVTTTVDSPTGERQVTLRHPDGSTEVHRMFQGPDGSDWGQVITRDGVRTSHQTFDPDGTLRRVVKTEDGRMLVSTTKTTHMPDRSVVTEVHDPSGDVYTMTSRPDGTAENRVDHPDGSSAVTTLVTDSEGAKTFTSRAEDGSITTTREWTENDGSSMRTVAWPDGHTDRWRTVEYTNKEGALVHVEESPTGVVATTNWPNGNVERETQHADGGVDTYSFTRTGATGIEREVRADGSTRETRFLAQSDDGSYTTITKGFDGVETISAMQRDGSMSIHKIAADGSSVQTEYKADGSGHTRTFDMDGVLTSDTAIPEMPRPGPGDFHPDRFLEDAQHEMPIGPPQMQTDPESHTFTDAELADLDARGIVPRDRAAQLDEATENDDGEPMVAAAHPDLEMPVGALGADLSTKEFVPPEPEFVRFRDIETEDGTTIRIHGVGDDVLVLGEDEEDQLVIHNVGDEPLMEPIDDGAPTLDAEESEGIDPFGSDPEIEEPLEPVVPETAPEEPYG